MITLTYQIAGATPVSATMRELSFIALPVVERISASTLRGVRVSHRSHLRTRWTIVITPDHAAFDYEFLCAYWSADRCWVKYPAATGTDIEVVHTSDGPIPVEHVEGLVQYPEVTFELEEKLPS